MASSETVGEFLIKMGVDADGVDRKVNDVVNNIGNSINNFVTGVLAPAMAGLASLDFFKTMSDDIVQADRLSESLGMNIEKFSAWQNAAELAGIEAEEVASLFSDMNDWKLDFDLNDSGPLKDFIDNGLISGVRDANGEMKKTEDYILEIADALAKMDKEQANGLLVQMGVSDLNMVAWLQQGGDAIREQLELMKKFGTYSEEDAKMATEFSMSIKLLSMGFKKSMLSLFHLLAPILTQIAKKFGDLSAEIQNFIPKIEDISSAGENVAQNVQQAFSVLYNNIMAFAPLLAGVGLMKLIGIFKSMATSIKKASIVARAFILSPWGIALTSLLAIGVAVQDFIKWLNGGDSALSSFFETLFGDADNAKIIIDDTFDSIKNAYSKVIENFSTLIPKFTELGKAVIDLFSAIVNSKGFDLVLSVIVAVIGFIVGAITQFIGFLFDNSDVIVSIIGGIADAFTFLIGVMTSIVNFISSLITSIVGVIATIEKSLSNFKDILTTIFNTVGETVSNVTNIISGAISDIISGLSSGIDTIKNIVDDIGNSINNGMNSAFSSVSDVTTPFIENITNNLSSGIDTIKSIVDDIGNSINSVFDNIFSGGLNNFSLDDSFTSTYDNISSLMASISDLFNSFSEPITNDIETVSSAFIPFIDVLNNLYNVFDEVINFIIELCTYLVDTISSGIDTIINLLYSLMNVVASVGGLISGVFNSMASSFSSFVSSVVSGANSIVGSIQGILNKLAELASNSLLGKILGSVGGSIYGALNNISSNIDNSNTTTNYDNKKITIKNIYPDIGDKFDLTQGVQAYL